MKDYTTLDVPQHLLNLRLTRAGFLHTALEKQQLSGKGST